MSNLDPHLISAKECEVLAEDYVKTNYAEINRRRPATKPDSKMYSIDLDVLQEYLKMISIEMDQRGIKKKGVRVTLGKYPDMSKDPKLKPEYLGYQMIFFSPVDFDSKEVQNKDSSLESSSAKSLDDVSNLNYMNITPPF